MTDMVLDMWTIYDSPADCPGFFVVRRWEIRHGFDPIPTEDKAISKSLLSARRAVPAGCVRFLRNPSDDPSIVETWM